MGEEFLLPAAAFEREARDRYREFEAWFDERGLTELAALCARLASQHGEDGVRVARAGTSLPDADVDATRRSWIRQASGDAAGDEAFYCLATAQQLIEVALAEETAAACNFDAAAHSQPDARDQGLAATLGASSRVCARELAIAMEAVSPPDWEALIAGGGGPCLALGAERRLRRT